LICIIERMGDIIKLYDNKVNEMCKIIGINNELTHESNKFASKKSHRNIILVISFIIIYIYIILEGYPILVINISIIIYVLLFHLINNF